MNFQNQWAFRNGLGRARIKAGNAAVAYQEARGNRGVFHQLVNLCIAKKNPGQLEALLALHREAQPDEPNLEFRQLDLHWLSKLVLGSIGGKWLPSGHA